MFSKPPYGPSRTRDDLTPSQARQIHDRIAPTLDYLNRLQNRMVTLKFRTDDPLFRRAQDAYGALFSLAAELRSLERRLKIF